MGITLASITGVFLLNHPAQIGAPSSLRQARRLLRVVLLAPLALIAMLCLFGIAVDRSFEWLNPAPGEFIDSAGIRFHFIRQGEGHPVVFVHGNPDFHINFQQSLFQKDHEGTEFIAIDRPGHGYSTRPAGHLSLTAQVDALHKAIVALHLKTPTLLGHSWGGALVLKYAEMFPGDVHAIVHLCATSFIDHVDPPLLLRAASLPVLKYPIIYGLLIPFGDVIINDLMSRAFSPVAPVRQYAESYSRSLRRFGPIEAAIDDMRIGADEISTLQAGFAELPVKTYVVACPKDKMVNIERSMRLFLALPHAEIESIQNAGHEVHFTDPERVLAVIKRAALGG